MAFKPVWDADWTDNRSILGEQEFKLQAGLIRLAAAEAPILSNVRERGEIVEMRFHAGRASLKSNKTLAG